MKAAPEDLSDDDADKLVFVGGAGSKLAANNARCENRRNITFHDIFFCSLLLSLFVVVINNIYCIIDATHFVNLQACVP